MSKTYKHPCRFCDHCKKESKTQVRYCALSARPISEYDQDDECVNRKVSDVR